MRILDPIFRVFLALIVGIWSPIFCCCASASEGPPASGEALVVRQVPESPSDVPSCHAAIDESDSSVRYLNQQNPVSSESTGHCDGAADDRAPGGDCECSTQLQSATLDHDAFTPPVVSGTEILPPLTVFPDFFASDFPSPAISLTPQSERPIATEGCGGTLRAQHVLLTV